MAPAVHFDYKSKKCLFLANISNAVLGVDFSLVNKRIVEMYKIEYDLTNGRHFAIKVSNYEALCLVKYEYFCA
jgi:hypothetical protein